MTHESGVPGMPSSNRLGRERGDPTAFEGEDETTDGSPTIRTIAHTDESLQGNRRNPSVAPRAGQSHRPRERSKTGDVRTISRVRDSSAPIHPPKAISMEVTRYVKVAFSGELRGVLSRLASRSRRTCQPQYPRGRSARAQFSA